MNGVPVDVESEEGSNEPNARCLLSAEGGPGLLPDHQRQPHKFVRGMACLQAGGGQHSAERMSARGEVMFIIFINKNVRNLLFTYT